MSQCFALGSKRDLAKEPLLRILHSIEFLRYDLENERIDVWGDFIVQNKSSKSLRLYGLHRGNIGFSSATDDWHTDNYWTSTLSKYASTQLGLEIDLKTHEIYEYGRSLNKVELLHGKLIPWGPQPDSEEYCYFTGWASPDITPNTTILLRVVGRIEGHTYEILLGNKPNSRVISITGGEPLLKDIESDIKQAHFANTDKYARAFQRYKSKYLCIPEYYHVFFERVGDRTLQTISVTSDMTKVLINEPIGKDRHINWLWSDSDFNIRTLANGPVVKLLTA